METPTVQRIAMKAVIANENDEILVLREAGEFYSDGTNPGIWLIPGGRLDVGEHWRDGLLREAKEETGLDIEPIEPIFMSEWRPVIKGVLTQIVAVFFLCRSESSEIRLSEEHDEYRWIGHTALHEITFSQQEIETIEKAFKILERSKS